MLFRFLGPYLLVALSLAAPSVAVAGGITIRRVDTSGYPLIRVTVVTGATAGVAPTLSENGQAVAGLQAVNLGREQSIVLALKYAQSMSNIPLGPQGSAGRPIANAIKATQAFVDSKPGPDQVAVIAFASEALKLADFSSATTDADTALGSIAIDPVYGTVEYDALVLAAHELRSHGLPGRSIVLVSDGLDTRSKATLAEAIRAARAARAAIYVVAIRSGAFAPRPLLALARRTGGSYYLAPSLDKLKGIYGQIGAELAHTWQLQYATAARPGDLIRLQARLGHATGTFSERLPGQPRSSSGSNTPVLLVVLGCVVGAGVLGLILAPKAAYWLRRRRW